MPSDPGGIAHFPSRATSPGAQAETVGPIADSRDLLHLLMADYAHSPAAEAGRAAKARQLAGYLWDRDISGSELLGISATVRRKLARAAGVNPPGTEETWHSVARLLDEKAEWAARHPGHPAAARHHTDEKLLWVKPPVAPW